MKLAPDIFCCLAAWASMAVLFFMAGTFAYANQPGMATFTILSKIPVFLLLIGHSYWLRLKKSHRDHKGIDRHRRIIIATSILCGIIAILLGDLYPGICAFCAMYAVGHWSMNKGYYLFTRQRENEPQSIKLYAYLLLNLIGSFCLGLLALSLFLYVAVRNEGWPMFILIPIVLVWTLTETWLFLRSTRWRKWDMQHSTSVVN